MDTLNVSSSSSKPLQASVDADTALDTDSDQNKSNSSLKSLKVSKMSQGQKGRKKRSMKEILPVVRKTRSSSKSLNQINSSNQIKSKFEVVEAKDEIPRKIKVVAAKRSPNISATSKISVVKTPKSSRSSAAKTPKIKSTNCSMKLETPKSSKKKALDHTTVQGSAKKLSKKVKSPITKTLQSVTESLIMKNQFQMNTPTKFKIYRSKNEDDEVKHETVKDFSIFSSPSPKKVVRPRVELPEKYLSSSNVSFDDDPFANEPKLSIEKRLEVLVGAEKSKQKLAAAMSLNTLITTLEGK